MLERGLQPGGGQAMQSRCAGWGVGHGCPPLPPHLHPQRCLLSGFSRPARGADPATPSLAVLRAAQIAAEASCRHASLPGGDHHEEAPQH